MKVKVLGSSAGGGFPQWNCNCRNCDGVRKGTIAARRRTQSSIAVSVDGVAWLLVNASPDILAQIAANPEMQPGRHARDTGIAAVLLMDAQIDHVTGLLMLRENSAPLPLSAIEDCVRACARSVPRRRPSQLRQLQFHCGKPPPAAEPRTWICTSCTCRKRHTDDAGVPLASAVGDVHRDFEAETHVGCLRGLPLHIDSPVERMLGCGEPEWLAGIECRGSRDPRHRHSNESSLTIFIRLGGVRMR